MMEISRLLFTQKALEMHVHEILIKAIDVHGNEVLVTIVEWCDIAGIGYQDILYLFHVFYAGLRLAIVGSSLVRSSFKRLTVVV